MKYFKPKSLTWWTCISCFVLGTILSVHAAYNLGKLGDVLVVMTSDFSPLFMIAQGLGLVGLRGAVA
jgi:hypothetical protein